MHIPMRLLRCILLLTLLGPTQGLAQGTPAPPEAAPTLTPPPIVPAPEAPEEAPEEMRNAFPRSSRSRLPGAVRITAITLAGALTGVAAGVGGAFLADQTGPSCDAPCEVHLLGFAIGLSLGSPLGVYGIGTLLDGEGRFVPTLLGALAGGVTGSLIMVFGSQITPLAFYLPVTAPLIGAILGYELFGTPEAPSPEGSVLARAGVQLHPVVSVTRSGSGVFGLVGRF